MSYDFLNEHQIDNLKQRDWVTYPKGQYLTLYRDDFRNNIQSWIDICDELDADQNCESIDILYFGIKTFINL